MKIGDYLDVPIMKATGSGVLSGALLVAPLVLAAWYFQDEIKSLVVKFVG